MSITGSQLKAKFKASDRNWDQLCQAGVVNASIWSGGFVQTYPSAIAAYRASKIVSKNPAKAPRNAVHYWDIGKYGHVAGGLGGSRVFMASKYVDVFWGINVGETTVERYTKRTGARYLGWSYSNGVNKLRITAPAVSAAKVADQKNVKILAAYLNKRSKSLKLGLITTAANDGERGKIYWKLLQLVAKHDGKYGKGYIVDGDPGSSGSLTRKLEKEYLAIAKKA